MIIYGASNIGKVRKDNQDSYLFDTVDENTGFAVVCDGMGGVSGGKTASSNAVNIFSSNLKELEAGCTESQLKDIFSQAIDSANKEIFEKGSKSEELKGMGTTLVSAVISNNTAYFLNIGDSRAYLIRKGVITRITRDHSAVQEMIDQGILTENQARNHPNKNIITRALGVNEHIEFDFFKHELEENDIIVLCTDGITNYVADLEINFEIAKHQYIESVAQKLIELANSRGGADNSTVVIIKI